MDKRPQSKNFDYLMGIISASILFVYTVFLGVFLYAFIFMKWAFSGRIGEFGHQGVHFIAFRWLAGILWWIDNIYRPKWDISGIGQVNPNGWYLITANHQSWVDIFVLYRMYHGKAPLLKFFIKDELKFVPIVGQAWKALDFPFMKRYSKSYLEKYPEKAGDDLKETQVACEKFSQMPTSVMNFLEGTRFTRAKHDAQSSPYKHLLRPKAGGLAFAMQALGDKFATLTNITIVYPSGIPNFWDCLCGRLGSIVVKCEEVPIPATFSQGRYQDDPALRTQIQNWVSDIWLNKDHQITQVIHDYEGYAKESRSGVTSNVTERS
ncbi:acyltransferase [Bermanella sp. R86510]|uniref:acyltransferase n=1 Tax=unclassified Bermanella TaxID=2627862 RepID=UPI0037C56A96